MFFSNKNSFTLIEMMIVIVIISIGVVGIMNVITYGLNFVGQVRQDIISINLAREGVEGVYNIRDTNWKRGSGKRDQCRLAKDPQLDNTSGDCSDFDWMKDENYILSGKQSAGNNFYNYLTGNFSQELNILSSNNITNDDKNYALCNDGDGFWYPCPGENNFTSEGRFFRIIEGKGLYSMKNGTSINCKSGNDTYNGSNDCGNNTAKEYRFCSKVQYIGENIGETEFCASITNFKK